MSNYIPTFKPTNKRRSFRPSSFRPLDAGAPPSLAELSDQLRASLMNVGMRVRKSVPEGYKTAAAGKPGFSIYEQTAAAHPELLLPPVDLTAPPTRAAADPIFDDDNDENAMTDEQVAATVEDVLSRLHDDLAGFGGGSSSSSQESNASASSCASAASSVRDRVPSSLTAGARRKRVAHSHDSNDGTDEAGEDAIDRLWGGVPMERDVPLRQIAQPRSRRRPTMTANTRRLASSDANAPLTTRKRGVAFVPDDDFGEADFLMPDQP